MDPDIPGDFNEPGLIDDTFLSNFELLSITRLGASTKIYKIYLKKCQLVLYKMGYYEIDFTEYFRKDLESKRFCRKINYSPTSRK